MQIEAGKLFEARRVFLHWALYGYAYVGLCSLLALERLPILYCAVDEAVCLFAAETVRVSVLTVQLERRTFRGRIELILGHPESVEPVRVGYCTFSTRHPHLRKAGRIRPKAAFGCGACGGGLVVIKWSMLVGATKCQGVAEELSLCSASSVVMVADTVHMCLSWSLRLCFANECWYLQAVASVEVDPVG